MAPETVEEFQTSNLLLDPNSVVDLMKSRGMDSSFRGRQQYASANGITGTPGSAAWNTKIWRHISGDW